MGLYGGGLFEASNNTITFSNLMVEKNVTLLGAGGINTGFYFSSSFNHFNKIYVLSCTMIGNKAYFGGGAALFVTSASSIDPNNHIEYHDSVWKHNEATYGSAIYLEPLFSDTPANTIFLVPHFVNCSFINNYITFNVSGGSSSGAGISAVGAGAMNSKAISFKLSGLITFIGNNGNALYLINSKAIVLENTSVIFTNNTGTYDGAMSINGFASGKGKSQ